MLQDRRHLDELVINVDSYKATSSKVDKRCKEILSLLLHQGKTSIDELTAMLKMSPASIRRYLILLEKRGLVHRTHGGAMLAGQTVFEPFRFNETYKVREDRFLNEKRRIARAATDMIQNNETIGLTAGTTTSEIARCLRHRTSLHVITNAVNIGMELSSTAGLDTTLTGGRMRWEGAFSLIGPTAIESLSTVVMDRAFISVCGVDHKRGATIIETDEAAVFRAMTRQTKQVIVVADSSKVGMVSPAIICPASEIDMLITDDGVPEETIALFTKAGIRIMRV
jgi:DeoR family transcriptional regulator of aga operon